VHACFNAIWPKSTFSRKVFIQWPKGGPCVSLVFGHFFPLFTTQSIFPIARDPKLTADALGLRCRAPKTNLCTPVLMPFGSNVRPLLNLYTMAEGWALRLAGFRPFLSAFPQLKAYFPLPGTLNLLPTPLVCAAALRKRICALLFQCHLAQIYGSLPKSLYNGRKVDLASPWFSAISVRFSTTQSIFPIARDPKLTADALGLPCSASKTNLSTPVSMPFGPNLWPLPKS